MKEILLHELNVKMLRSITFHWILQRLLSGRGGFIVVLPLVCSALQIFVVEFCLPMTFTHHQKNQLPLT